MEKKSQDFSMEDALRLAQSPAARQLMDLMRSRDPAAVDRAMNQAVAGDYGQALDAMEQLLAVPEIRQLLGKLGDSRGRS
ncbi:MAG: hypothetical protein IKC09_05245 [Oscillospiraceae bacterium]|nr:hypothetical protein [Oscillospiraceae bacterium]